MKEHDFTSRIVWTGNRGQGTGSYRSYDRTWDIAIDGRALIHCSNDPLLGGDPNKMNPEDLLLSALSACHMLWYLHLASDAGIVVTGYEDYPVGHGESAPSGTGRLVSATLKPHIRLTPSSDEAAADAIHMRISESCFIARSVSFPVRYEAAYEVG